MTVAIQHPDDEGAQGPKVKKVYARPAVRAFGPVVGVTLGPSPGIGESGNPGTLRGAGMPP